MFLIPRPRLSRERKSEGEGKKESKFLDMYPLPSLRPSAKFCRFFFLLLLLLLLLATIIITIIVTIITIVIKETQRERRAAREMDAMA